MMLQTPDFGVRVERAFGSQRPGTIIFPNAMYRERLLHGGWVSVVVPEQTQAPLTEDVPESPMNRALGRAKRTR